MKKFLSLVITFVMLFSMPADAACLSMSVDEVESVCSEIVSAVDASVAVDAHLMTYAKSVLLMEKSTGKVLYAENENEQLFPASVTKIMTILLVCEALENEKISLEDTVSCSENAASKGGSQIWLEPGEAMTVEELLKATCVYSANDACTLLGEYVAGSESAFNSLMNSRAKELGMNNTHFDNCTGLDDTTDMHKTTAYDIALMARELLKYDFIKQYTTIWMDSLRNGETQLVNTNKLIRYYKGITGLKTGTTEKAGCCVCATAERDSMELIAVVMGSENSNDRFKSAENLLDWGFANYETVTPQIDDIPQSIAVKLGEKDFLETELPMMKPVLVNKGNGAELICDFTLTEELTAPVKKGDSVGYITVRINDEIVSEYDITAGEDIASLSFFSAFMKLMTSFSARK